MASANDSLAPNERVAARHYLQVIMETARSIRNAMDPNHGVPVVRRELFLEDLANLQASLDQMRKIPITINKLPGDGQ
jgi:hypothetical protein